MIPLTIGDITVKILGIALVLSFGKSAFGDPACYMELPSGEQVDLEDLCEPEPDEGETSATTSDLGLDRQSIEDMESLGLAPNDLQEIRQIAYEDPDMAEQLLIDKICAQQPQGQCDVSPSNVEVDFD